MFNGIIKYTGKVKKIYKAYDNCVMQLESKLKMNKEEIGSSISCSGACLTLEKYKKKILSFYVSKETLKRTNFKSIKNGDLINLEKSLKYGDRMSGHFVQGHIDTTCKVNKIILVGKSWVIDIEIKKKYKKYIVEKGSVAINGISLTVARVLKNNFQIAIIPKTLELTNLKNLKKNDLVNVEFDILAKYIKGLD